jgi:hypothetical protein
VRTRRFTAGQVLFGKRRAYQRKVAVPEFDANGTPPDGAYQEEVLAAHEVIRNVLNEELDDRQARAGVAPPRRIVVTDLAVPQQVIDRSPPVERSVAAIIGTGLFIAIALSVALDSALSRWQSREPRNRASGLEAIPATRPEEPGNVRTGTVDADLATGNGSLTEPNEAGRARRAPGRPRA